MKDMEFGKEERMSWFKHKVGAENEAVIVKKLGKGETTPTEDSKL